MAICSRKEERETHVDGTGPRQSGPVFDELGGLALEQIGLVEN